MYYVEVENVDKEQRGYAFANNREEMHNTLIHKGFSCLVKYECYAGYNESGDEISVVNHFGAPVSKLNPVN